MCNARLGEIVMLKLVVATLLITSFSGIADAKISVSRANTYEEKKIEGKKFIRICKKGGSKKKPVLHCETINLDEVSAYCNPPKAPEGYEEAQYASGCCFQKGEKWKWLNNCSL
jgi:hypothetical protein